MTTRDLQSYKTKEFETRDEDFNDAMDGIAAESETGSALTFTEIAEWSDFNELIENITPLPAGRYVLSYLLGKYHKELAETVNHCLNVSDDNEEWVGEVLAYVLEDTAEADDVVEAVLDEVVADAVKNHCVNEQGEVLASFTPGRKTDSAWARVTLKKKITGDTLRPNDLFMLAFITGMSLSKLQLFLTKCLGREELNEYDPKEMLIKTAFGRVPADQRLQFFHQAYTYYRECTVETVKKENKKQGYRTSEFSDSVENQLNELKVMDGGKLTDEMKKMLAEYKREIETTEVYRRTATQVETALTQELMANYVSLQKEQLGAEYEDHDIEDYVHREVSVDFNGSEKVLEKGEILTAGTLDEKGKYHALDEFRGLVTERIVPAKDTHGECSVTVRLRRRDTLAGMIKANSPLLFEDWIFVNEKKIAKKPEKDEVILVTGTVPKETVIHEGDTFMVAETGAELEAAETAVAWMPHKAYVTYVAEEEDQKDGIVEKGTEFHFADGDDHGMQYMRNDRKFQLKKEKKTKICGGYVYVNCSDEDFEKWFTPGTEMYCMTEGKKLTYVIKEVNEKMTGNGLVQLQCLKGGEWAAVEVTKEGSRKLSAAPENLWFGADEKRGMEVVRAVDLSRDQMNVRKFIRDLYENYDMEDPADYVAFTPEAEEQLRMILAGKFLNDDHLTDLYEGKEKIRKFSRDEIITLTFLNEAAKLQLRRLRNEEDDDEMDSTEDIADFVYNADENLETCGCYGLYAGNPYESLLVKLLAAHEPFDLYRKICQVAKTR